MSENQGRRQARRQERGLARRNEILVVAGVLFAEVGYEKATTNLIAERAGISPGSLYQFYPHKEAIAQAYAAAATARLHQVYDAMLAPAVTSLPLPAFLDRFVDALIAFNRADPGYLALAVASTLSPALALAELQQGIFARLEALVAALWPEATPEQRRLRGLVSYRLFLALLPLAISGPAADQPAIVAELKAVLYRYWAPLIEGPPPAASSAP